MPDTIKVKRDGMTQSENGMCRGQKKLRRGGRRDLLTEVRLKGATRWAGRRRRREAAAAAAIAALGLSRRCGPPQQAQTGEQGEILVWR